MSEVTSEVTEKVKQIIVEHLGTDRDKILNSTNFVDDLGCDSLDMVELAMAFEDEYNIEIADDETEKVQTVGQLIELLERKTGNG